jgi:hypothetical protein
MSAAEKLAGAAPDPGVDWHSINWKKVYRTVRQVHHRVWRTRGGTDGLDNLELLHANCHRQRHSKAVGNESGCVSREAFGRLEPDASNRRTSGS